MKIKDDFGKAKKDLTSQFKQVSYVSVTADIWSSRHRSFTGMTCHWIDCIDLCKQSRMLAFRRFKGKRDYIGIAKLKQSKFIEFQLPISTIMNVMTDNGSNFLKDFREHGDDVSDDSEAEEEEESDRVGAKRDSEYDAIAITTGDDEILSVNVGNILEQTPTQQHASDDENLWPNYDPLIVLSPHESCVAHTLDLMTKHDSQKVVEDSRVYKKIYRNTDAKCSRLSNAVHRRVSNAEEAQDILGRMIPKPNDTSWNSKFYSWSVISDNSGKINTLVEKLKLPNLQLLNLIS